MAVSTVSNGTFITGSGPITVNTSGLITVGSSGYMQINGNLVTTGSVFNAGSISAGGTTIQVDGMTLGYDADSDIIQTPSLDNGGSLSGGTLAVGATLGSNGWARTSGGADSATFTTTIVGGLGSGNLNIGDDGSVDENNPTTGNFHTGSLMVGQTATGAGNISVLGSFSAGSATIGELGQGFLSTDGQASISFTGPVVVGDGSTSFAQIDVSGEATFALSSFSDTGQLTVGNAGAASLEIGAYSIVNIGTLQIGSTAGGSGQVAQTGPDISFTASTIHIGSSSGGIGTYTLDGGSLSAGSIDIAPNGTLISLAGTLLGTIGLDGGTYVDSGGSINGTLTLNSGNLKLSTLFSSGSITVNDAQGSNVQLNGSPFSPFSGAGFGLFAGAGTMNNFNTLSGNGTLLANQILNNNGTFSSANGDFTVTAGATLTNGSLGLLGNSPASNLRILTTNFTNLGNLQVNADGGVQLSTSLTIPSGKSLTMLGGLFTNGASLTIAAGGALSGFGQIDSNLVNHGSSTFTGAMNVLGNLTNDGTITARDATSIIYGSVSNTGSIIVQNGTIVFENALGGDAVGSGGLDGVGLVNVGAGGQMLASYVRQNSLSITGTSLSPAETTIRSARVGGAVSRVSSLTITNGEMDLADTGLIVDYTIASPLTTIRGYLQTGRGNGNWQGLGLTSSLAAAVAADSSNHHKTAIGYGEASALNIGSFLGQSVDATTVVARYTLVGDANLDGMVNGLDFNALAAGYNQPGKFWTDGDFNYDGIVNAEDFDAISANYGQSISSSPPLGALVPEPGMILAASLAATFLRPRRRRRRFFSSSLLVDIS